MKTYEKDRIIRELLETIDGLRAEIKEHKEKLEEYPKPTRTMGGRTFVRGARSVPGVIQNDNNPL